LEIQVFLKDKIVKVEEVIVQSVLIVCRGLLPFPTLSCQLRWLLLMLTVLGCSSLMDHLLIHFLCIVEVAEVVPIGLPSDQGAVFVELHVAGQGHRFSEVVVHYLPLLLLVIKIHY